jgi:hypothetical protein
MLVVCELGVCAQHRLVGLEGQAGIDATVTCLWWTIRPCVLTPYVRPCSCGVSVCSCNRPMRWTCLGVCVGGGGALSMAVPISRGFVVRRASSSARGLGACTFGWGGGTHHGSAYKQAAFVDTL